MLQSFIMLVDDEKPFLDTMAKRLSKRKLSVITAESGDEALNQLEKHSDIDVIILDVKMPGLDGIDTLREVKKRHPLVPVIMLTGHATVENAIEGMKLGAFDYLMKPCEMDKLMSKVDEAVKQKKIQEKKIQEAMVLKAMARP